MHRWLCVAKWIDGTSERVGKAASWLVLAVVLLGAWNAVARYMSRFSEWSLSSNAQLELQWYLFSALFLLGGAYTLKRDEHVRVDVWHASLHPRTQAWIDVAGTVFFLIPFSVFILWASWFPVRNSWLIFENSPDPGGLPRYPVKTLIPVAFLLLLMQGVAILIKRIAFLREHRGGEPRLNIQHSPANIQHPRPDKEAINQKPKIQNLKSPGGAAAPRTLPSEHQGAAGEERAPSARSTGHPPGQGGAP